MSNRKYHYEYRLIGSTRNGGWINQTYHTFQAARFDWALFCGGRIGCAPGHARIEKFRVYDNNN